MNYGNRRTKELEIFNDLVDIHELPDIFHYWSNKYLKPMLQEFDISHPDDLFANNMYDSAVSCNVDRPVFASIGTGNCEIEVRVAKLLRVKGLQEFRIDCVELNPKMLERGHDHAREEGVLEHLSFVEGDFNEWKADKEYISVIASQSLHHVMNLEGLFSEIKDSLHADGAFITSDMIGRNGHQRWPEALRAMHSYWQELPEKYRYNHQLKRHEDLYENWDCSVEGFEGIRPQDILPLLIQNFNFQLFIGFANIIDIFIDRGFGPNFDAQAKWDCEFIDRVHEFDERCIRIGFVKPTHIMAVMRKSPVENPRYSRGLSPNHCVRDPRGILLAACPGEEGHLAHAAAID